MMRRSRFQSRVMVAGAVLMAAGAGGLAGCESSHADQVRVDPTPELETLYQNDEDIANALTRTFDENGRMFWQDMGRAFYWDRPSRLTREPVPVP